MNKYSRRTCCVDATVLSPFPKEAADTHTNKQQGESDCRRQHGSAGEPGVWKATANKFCC